MDAGEIQAYRNRIEWFKETYSSLYPGERISEKLIQSFCSIHKIPWPLPKAEEQDITDEFDFLR